MEQGHYGGDVLAYPSEVRKGFIIGDDPSVHVTGHGACARTISAAFNLPIDLRVLPNKLCLALSISRFRALSYSTPT